MGSRIVRRCRAGRPTLVGVGLFCRACSPAPAEAGSNSRSWFLGMAGWVRLRGRRKPVHGARSPHPCGSRRNRTHPAFDSSAICRNGIGVSTLVDTVDPRHAWMIHSISDRKIVSTKVDTYQQPRGTTAAVTNSRVNLSRWGGVRVSAHGCAKPPRTGLRRPRTHTARQPTDSPLLTLTLIDSAGAGLQALPTPRTEPRTRTRAPRPSPDG
jgi:hypothetical protein